jgi:phosphoribosyl-AMP cyclohydrolase
MYLQLKTLKSPTIKGKILIDSPGFDADSQRDAILRITNHIVEMSDLVLIFFDARHPEPGAMRDTLEHLVATTIGHKDANKVLYILNQIDTTAQEDNLEDVLSSWQRALAKEGLVSGNFYSIYNENAAMNIDDDAMRLRLKTKKDNDLAKIVDRMDKVSIERAYRIIKTLDDYAKEIKNEKIPLLKDILAKWGKKVWWTDSIVMVLLLLILGVLHFQFGILDFLSSSMGVMIAGSVFVLLMLLVHFKARSYFSRKLQKKWEKEDRSMAGAIGHNTKWWRTTFGYGDNWNKKIKEKLELLMMKSKEAIQELNDQFVSPLSKSNHEETVHDEHK